MKTLLFLFSFTTLIAINSSGQVIYTPGTYFVIPPTSGCNGVWAIQNTPGCPNVLLHPCWSYGYVSGDTLFLNLCSLPCYYAAATLSGDLCPTQICDYAPFSPPTAGFLANDTNLCAVDSIQVQNTSVNAVSYQWSAPGAIPASSTDVHPYFQFPATGTYNLTLIAANPDGATDTVTQALTVNIEPLPVASFSTDAVVSLSNQPASFTNNSTGAVSCFWDFGDGSTSADFNPLHSFDSAGSFVVMLIASKGTCPDDTTWQEVMVVDDLGIGNSATSGFVLYPNPSTGQLTISRTGHSQEHLVDFLICDVHGRIILEWFQADMGEDLRIDLDHWGLTPGIYFLQASTPETTTVQKLVVR